MRLEHWWFTAPLRLRSILRRRRVEREPDEARHRALRAMGGLEQRKEEARDMRRVHWFTDFVDDVRYATRSLRRTPALTAFVVITIAIGIGMSAMHFSMLDALV